MKKGKRLFPITVFILALTLILAVIPTEAEGAIYEDTVRLHILANSDSQTDQAIKLRLRDEILKEYSKELSVFNTAKEAGGELVRLLPEIEDFANGCLEAWGIPYSATASFSTEWFERREYGEVTIPEGYYNSLIISLGEAEGKNWWCVMFPPMCVEVSSSSAPSYTNEEQRLVAGGKYSVKLKILELLSGVFK